MTPADLEAALAQLRDADLAYLTAQACLKEARARVLFAEERARRTKDAMLRAIGARAGVSATR